MREIKLSEVDFKKYEGYLENEREEIDFISRELRGLRVAFINSTSFGGGVAEIFYSLIPLLRSLGIDIHWYVIEGDGKFFNITKKIHNMLQGEEESINSKEEDYYLLINKNNGENFNEKFDIIVIHDPQPMALPLFLNKKTKKFVWRCHIDTSSPSQRARNFVGKFIKLYERVIFSVEEFARGLKCDNNSLIIHPSIDPFSQKNKFLEQDVVDEIVEKFGVDIQRPFLLQVSRFDPWKDPLGVIDVYRNVKVDFPNIQLVLIGSMATDDPEGWKFYEKTLRYAGMDEDIFVFTNFDGVGSLEVNAFQRKATIVIQKSIREGFGLTVSEALWKKKAVIGGNTGGIKVQIKNGKNGFLVSSKVETEERVKELLLNGEEREEFGRNGHAVVRKKFLTTRHALDYLKLFKSLAVS